jgi:outer membrane usher protein
MVINDTTRSALAFNVSIPLEKFLPQTWANYGVSASQHNGTTHNIGLNGVALENHALNWNVQQGYGSDGVGYTGNLNGDYKGTYAELTAGYSYDKNSERLNYGLQGRSRSPGRDHLLTASR